MTDGWTEGQTDGGDCNIPDAFLKTRGDNKLSCLSKEITYQVNKFRIISNGTFISKQGKPSSGSS